MYCRIELSTLILLGLLFNKLNTTSTYYAVRYVSWEYEPLWASLHACCSPQCTTLWVYNYTIQYNCATQLHNATVLYKTTLYYTSVHAHCSRQCSQDYRCGGTDVQNLENLETYDIWYRMISYDMISYHIIWTMLNSEAFYEKEDVIRYLFYLSLNNQKISVLPLLQLSQNICFIFSSIIRRYLFYLTSAGFYHLTPFLPSAIVQTQQSFLASLFWVIMMSRAW